MSKHFIFSATLITLVLFAAVAASAQFTISIPNIPKIKKPKTTQTQDSNQNNTNNTSNNTTNNNNSQDSNAKPSGGCDQYSFVIGVFVDDIKKKQAEAGPETKNVVEMDRRVGELEKILGSSTTSLDEASFPLIFI